MSNQKDDFLQLFPASLVIILVTIVTKFSLDNWSHHVLLKENETLHSGKHVSVTTFLIYVLLPSNKNAAIFFL